MVSADPFHRIADPETKPDPLTPRVNDEFPAVAELGLRLVIVGVADVGLIVKANAFEIVPPGFVTVTLALPAVAIRPAETEAVNCVAPPKVVAIGEPFHRTEDPETKPEPFTVRVNAGPPAVVVLGLRLVIETVDVAELMVKLTALETVPPGFRTVIFALPALAIRLADTAAVSCVTLTYAVGNAEPLH